MSRVAIDLHPWRHHLCLMVTYLILQMSFQLFLVHWLVQSTLVEGNIRRAGSRVCPSTEGARDLILLPAESSLTDVPLAELASILCLSAIGMES